MSVSVSKRTPFSSLLNGFGWLPLILLWLSPLIPAGSASGQSAYPEKVAANIGGIGSGPMRAFVDVTKTSNRWKRADGSTLNWEGDRDENGWPTRDFQMIAFDWRLWGGWWEPPYDDPERRQIDVSGVYKVSFKGEATIGTFAGDSYFDVSNQVYDPATNTTTADLYVWSQSEVLQADPNDNAGLLALRFTNTVNPESATGAGITDLRIIRPGYHDRPEQTFTDAFLNALAPFSALRFMDVQHTNNSNPFQGDPYPNNVTLWQDRVQRDSPSQVTANRGLDQPVVAWEYDIEIANEVGSDLWINIPVHAEDDYIKKLAILIAYGVDMGDTDVSGAYDLADGTQTTAPLDPSLRVYVEHSNEVWNFGFSQYIYNKLAAVEEAENGFDWGTTDEEQMARRRHLKRAYEAGQIFADVFEDAYGPDALLTKVRPVHAHWAGALSFGLSANWQQPIDWMEATYGPVSDYFYGFAIAPYMNDSGASDTATPEELLDVMVANSDASAAGVRDLFIDKCLNEWGVAPLTYEGGPDTGGGSTVNVGNRILANRLPGMKDAVKRDMDDNWFQRGGEVFAYFVVAGGASRHGSWGATEDVADLTAPKYQALLELAGDVSVQLLTAQIPDGETNTEYSVQLESFGGALPLSWSVAAGSLPAGVSLDASTGALTGVPAAGAEGVYGPVIRVTDSEGAYDEVELPFEILAFADSTPVFETDPTLPAATEGSPYQVNFAVSGGNGALMWSLPSPPDLPVGLSFDDGVLTGTPQASGSYSFDVWVADSDTVLGEADEARASFSLLVEENPSVPSSPSGLVAQAVSSTSIELTWVDNADNETGFEIQISGDGGQNFLQSETVGANETSFAHTGLTPETVYFYRVRAVNGDFASGFAGPEGTETLAEDIGATGPIAGFDFADNAGGEDSEAPSLTAQGVSVSDWTRGLGLMGSGNTYQGELGGIGVSGSRFDQADVAGAIAEEDYFEFTVTPDAGYGLNVQEVFYSAYAQQNGSDPENFSVEVMYSFDGFATGGTSMGGNTGVTPQTVGGMLGNPFTLSVGDVAELQGVTIPVTFRIYGYNGAAWTSRGIGFAEGNDFEVRGEVIPLEAQDPEPIVGFDFADNAGGEDTEAPSLAASGLIVGDLTRGAGLVGSGNTYQGELGGIGVSGSRFNEADVAGAIAEEDYFEFTVTPESGYTVSLESLFYSAYAQNNGTDPENFSIDVQYSLDGFATPGISVGGNAGVTPQTLGGMLGNPFELPLGDVAELQAVGSAITFRFYGYNGAGWTSRGIGFADGNDIQIVGTVASGVAEDPNEAQPYRYLRFWIDETSGSHVHLREVTWLSGENELPSAALSSNAGNDEVSVFSTTTTSGLIWLLFDKKVDAHWYRAPGHEATLDFGDSPVYPTGIRVANPSWSYVSAFRAEGSMDGESWDLLGEYTDLNTTDHYNTAIPGSDTRTATFDFGLNLPDDIPTAPAAPQGLAVDSTTDTEVVLSWTDASDDETGFEVQVSEDGGQTFARSILLDVDATGYVDSGLSAATEYVYRARAMGTDLNSGFAGPVSAVTASGSGQVSGEAQSYRYLRFWVDGTSSGGSVHFRELRWLFGEKELPFSLLTDALGDEDVTISTTTSNLYAFDGPWKVFDGDRGSHWYTPAGAEVTLDFGSIEVFPTGLRLESPGWSHITAFRAEGSKDGESWDLLANRSGLTRDDYPDSGDGVRVGDFDFGLTLPADVDQAAPSVPSGLSASNILDAQSSLSWAPSTDDGVGLSRYNIYVDGEHWTNAETAQASLYGLSPSTEYGVQVTALDLYGNESEPSEVLTINTEAMIESISPMTMGTGLGANTNGVWKSGVDFAAAWADYENANPFSQQFLDELGHYKVLRFMDWVFTNNNWIENWSDRRQPDNPDQSIDPNWNPDSVEIANGVAVEWQIKLCNLLGTDFWLNVPHAASDAYVQELAAVVLEHLDPGLNVWVEYSNEVWGGFGAETYAVDKGTELGLHQGDFARYDWFGDDEYARFRYTAYRSLQIHQIFEDTFGGESGRVVNVLAGWFGQTGLSKVHRDALMDPAINPNGRSIDVYALAPYFSFDIGATEDESFLAAMNEIDGHVAPQAEAHYRVWSALGVPLVCYEGGQHFTSGGEAINRTPMMYNAYNYYLDRVAPFFSAFAHYVHSASYGRGMAWGSKEYVGQPELLAFKYRALRDWALVNEDVEEVLAPVILRHPQDATVGEGSGASFSVSALGEAPFTYQWYKDGQAIAGANGATYRIERQLGLTDSGSSYHVVVSNSLGQTASDPATLQVEELPGKAVVEPTSAALAIDGVMESAWDQANAYPIATVNNGAVDNAADLSGTYRILWDEQGVYVFVSMNDDVLVDDETDSDPAGYRYDSVEVYFDWDNAKGDSYSNDAQYRFRWNDGITAGSGGPSLAGVDAASQVVAGGYTVEFFFPWAVSEEADPFADGRYIGFEVMANDNDEPGTNVRQGKVAWWSTVDRAWTDPSTFGTAYFEEPAAVEGDLNGDATVDASDGVILRSLMGARIGDDGYLPEADLDGDGAITRGDYALWYRIATQRR